MTNSEITGIVKASAKSNLIAERDAYERRESNLRHKVTMLRRRIDQSAWDGGAPTHIREALWRAEDALNETRAYIREIQDEIRGL